MFGDLFVDRLHALLRQRPRVFDAAIGKAVDHAARTIALLEFRILRIIRVLRLLFGVEVIEVAKELVEAVVGGQELVPVAQVVLAELAGDVAMRLEQLGDGGIFRLQPESSPGHADLGQAGADRVLAGDEGGPASRAALLAVEIGEGRTFIGDAIDVRGAIAHLAPAVVADVPPADVIAPENEDVWFSVRHVVFSLT